MSITPDILNDPCTSLDGWTLNTEGTITVSDGFKIEVPPEDLTSGAGKVLSSLPSTFTVEIKTNFTKLGLFENDGYGIVSLSTPSWIFQAFFTSDGLILYSNIGSFFTVSGAVVKHDETAEDQTWRFQIDKTVEATSTVEVFLEGVSLGNYGSGIALAIVPLTAVSLGVHASDVASEAHFKEVKIGTGLGAFSSGAVLTEINISPKTKYLKPGESQQITVTGVYDDGSASDVTSSATFSSSNSGVASVTSGGLVRSIATGMSSITATVGEFTATALIVVQYSLPQNSQIVSFASRHGVYRSMEYKTKRYKFKPTSLSCIKVIAEKYPVEIDVIFPSLKRAQSISVTSSRAQRIKSALVDCCEVVIRGNSQVSAVFLASSLDELPL